ncbi:MAG: YqgE/AlgH family protein [Emcibacter sp.]|nr:YqgE/AlgH family protein [Emcibacter sp.]
MIKPSYLTGHLLIAMPSMTDERFERRVIYICNHSEEGAMGLVINAPENNIDFPELLDQLNVAFDPKKNPIHDINNNKIIIHAGGPVEIGRGFILHTVDYIQETSLIISETIALSATIDILSAIAEGHGPSDFIVALGYSGWGKGQLESEIARNSWLTIEADEELLFRTDLDLKWVRAMAKLGVDITMLSPETGRA